ncbi:MAG: methyltransferase [Pseudonocardiaceae bacterium]|nr:methyltransferase [Pseudonocardiaceae bacterium]
MTESATEPSVEITRMMDGAVIAQLIHLVAELGVADVVDGARSVDELASFTGTEPEALYRALRTLASIGVFTEVAPRTFDLTSLAVPLRSDAEDSVRELATVRGSREHWLALGELRHSLCTGRSAFARAYGTDWWSYLDENPEHAAKFSKAMGDNFAQVHAAAAGASDFPDTKLLVDIGGGRGDLVATLLQRHPAMHAVVFDRPHAVADAAELLQSAGVADRAQVTAGDFFEGVPEGGDTYVLCRILHDWDDQQAAHIMSNVADVLPAGGRVVVIEAVVPEGDESHPAKLMDITMLAMHKGKERSESEFAALFESAGLRHVRTLHTNAQISVLIAEVDRTTKVQEKPPSQ